MGFFDFFNNDNKSIDTKANINIDVTVEAENASPSKKELKARELKKQATSEKKANIGKAIELLQKAIKIELEIAGLDEVILNDYIRLAKYLYKAQQKDEAWKLYNKLIIQYSNTQHKERSFYNLSEIYYAMAEQMDKEKKYKNALLNYLIYGFCRTKGSRAYLYRQQKEYIEMGMSEKEIPREEQELETNGIFTQEKFIFDDEEPDLYFIKRKKFPQEIEIRKQILQEYKGWTNFLKELNNISIGDFANTTKNTIETHLF